MIERAFVSVSMVDTPAKLAHLAQVITNHDINIEGFSVDHSSVHFLTQVPEDARAALTAQGHAAQIHPVLEMHLQNQPGELARIAGILDQEGISIVSTLGMTHGPRGIIYLRVDDLEKAKKALRGLESLA